jgi:hypothetical protein
MPAATAEQVRALRLLARHPDGCTEALMLAHAFTINVLARLVSDRLVTAELNPTREVWMQITDLGREALAQCAAN